MAQVKGINFDSMPAVYWDDYVKIGYLQRRIIVYSIVYYELGGSVVTDQQYDAISRQLVQMQKDVPESEFKKSMYYYAMYDFDGSTGFDIPSRLTPHDRDYLTKIARMVYRQ
jgi:hypothetical protein